MKRLTFVMMCVAAMFVATSRAQIAYQVSLLNAATGEARANVTVTADVSITDAAGKVLYSCSQRATSNNFGVLSLTVGNSETFTNTPPERMPFFISVTIDGVLVGRSQILSVPVADVAKQMQSSFVKDDLLGTWKGPSVPDLYFEEDIVQFFEDGNVRISGTDIVEWKYGQYEIEGNSIYCYIAYLESESGGKPTYECIHFRYVNNELWGYRGSYRRK